MAHGIRQKRDPPERDGARFLRKSKRVSEGSLTGCAGSNQPSAAFFPASQKHPWSWREQGRQQRLDDELVSAALRDKLTHALLVPDEGLLRAARMNGGLEKRGAGAGKTVEIAFQGAAFAKRRGIHQGVALARLQLPKRSANEHSELRHAARGAWRKARFQALACSRRLFVAGIVGGKLLDVAFKHG